MIYNASMSDASTSANQYCEQSREQLLGTVTKLDQKLKLVTHELDWFKRQLFGEKSERRFIDNPNQLGFAPGVLGDLPEPQAAERQKITYTRTKGPKTRPDDCVSDCGLRFDPSVPVKTIRLEPEGIEGLSEDDYEIISIKKTYRLAQRPASSVVLCYERPVIKLRESGAICQAPSPDGVLDKSLADVSFIAGMLVDKFEYHLPLHRQHQRLLHGGIMVSRSTLTNLVRRAIELLRPIVSAQLISVLESQVMAMDETPVKAGPSKTRPGKMKQGYFWPMYGDRDEICFAFAPSRAMKVIEQLLGEHFHGTLVVDGYAAYAAWVEGNERVNLAQCWVHTRRQFVEARAGEEQAVDQCLEIIGRLYRVEKRARKLELRDEALRRHRLEHAKPIVDELFAWHRWQNTRADLLPSDPFRLALAYLGTREHALRVFLAEPGVPLDTNHIERGLRRIPMGRKSWLFCWTELGAEHVGLIQSLIATCRLHDVNPYEYLVDVLQRVGTHPASRVAELTPRLWKEHFGASPLRSDLHDSS